MKILSNEERHDTLSTAYDELVKIRSNVTITTEAATRGGPTVIYASTQIFYNSFLQRP